MIEVDATVFFTTADIAREANISLSLVHQWVANRQLRAVGRAGRTGLYRREDVRRFLATWRQNRNKPYRRRLTPCDGVPIDGLDVTSPPFECGVPPGC